MSKFTEQLQTIGVFNPYEFAKHGQVYISYIATDRGRGGLSAHWAVYRRGFKTDPESPWYAYGNKTFHPSRTNAVTIAERKSTALMEAKQWAGEKYGIKEWARTPFGDWMDAAFVKRRVAELKAQIKAKEMVTA